MPNTTSPSRAWQEVSAAVAVGLVAGAVVAASTGLAMAYVLALGWDAAAVVYVVRLWVASAPLDAERTAAAALAEDPSRAVTDLALLAAAVASLGAVAFTLADASHSHGTGKGLRVALALGTIVASWFLVHTLFVLKYARQYYSGGDGGIDFKTDERPVWSDFAYVSFTLGMTFQVSDTDVQTTGLRRLVLRHALLSYLFGAVIIAVAINVVAGLNH